MVTAIKKRSFFLSSFRYYFNIYNQKVIFLLTADI